MNRMKTCTKCGETKPLDDFGRKGADKRRADCKPCHAAVARASYHQRSEEAHERRRERMRGYYAANPEKYKRLAQQQREQNRERAVATSMAWAKANPEKVNAYKRRWDKANPEKCRDKTRKRRALRLAAFVADVEFNDILIRDLGTCGICKAQITDNLVELDHIIPLAAGGTHEPDNVQLAHRTCNRRKHAKVNFTLA